MIDFVLGFAAGAVAAVLSPPVFRWIEKQIARIKDKV